MSAEIICIFESDGLIHKYICAKDQPPPIVIYVAKPYVPSFVLEVEEKISNTINDVRKAFERTDHVMKLGNSFYIAYKEIGG